MKILIVSTYFPPKNSIASLRAYSWAKYWSESGHDVTVLTRTLYSFETGLEKDCTSFRVICVAMPHWHETLMRRTSLARQAGKAEAQSSGLFSWVFKCINRVRDATGILRDMRMPSHLDWWYLVAKRLVNREEWDIVVTSFSPYAALLIGNNLKQNNRATRWVVDYRDLWTSNHLYRGLWPFRIFEEMLENRINRTADVITTVSEPLAERLRRKYGLRNIHVIENGFDDTDLNDLCKDNIFKDGKLTVVYTGSIYPGYQDPSPLFLAMKNLAISKGVGFLDNLRIVFAGINSDYALQLAERAGVSAWVQIKGIVPRVDSLRMQRDASVLLFIEFEAKKTDGILTGKVFEYINSGTLVWSIGKASAVSGGSIIKDAGCGHSLGVDVKEIEASIVWLLAQDKKTTIYPRQDVIRRYTRKVLAEKLLNLATPKTCHLDYD